MNNICQYAKRLWELYMFGETPEEAQELLEAMDEKISIIGTGKHEFYEELAAFADALGMEEPEREAIQFHIQSIWAKEQAVSDGVKLVYGGLHVTGTGRYAEVAVDMDTRYTMVFQRTAKEESGQKEVWKLVHIHQSLPYIDQQEGEYYPKTLLDQVGEAKERAAYLEQLAAMDQLTGLLNHSAFFNQSGQLLRERGGGYCMTIDLDDFKQINDSYGHLAGDAVLQKMGTILRHAVENRGVAGRVGGDEFAAFLDGISSSEEACAIAEQMMAQASAESCDGTAFPSLSIGISRTREGEKLKEAFRRADDMLYQVKRSGKHGCRFCE